MATETPVHIVPDEHSVGFVETRTMTLFGAGAPLRLEGGQTIGPVDVAYETYGTLSPRKDNAIYVCHALTGDAHAAGFHSSEDRKPGWWDGLIGPGKALDTNQYFVICANVVGGCQGTTGPRNTNPLTQEPYALDFPFITVGDMVTVHWELVQALGITKLLAVIGGSLGGMQVLDWSIRFPHSLHAAICLASAARLGAQGISFNAVGRRAIYADPHFNSGKYYAQTEKPRYGLALARMVAHITYLSEASIEKKFGRRLQNSNRFAYELLRETEFQIESYLHYQGKRFVERFDANSYLYLTRAMDYFDLAESTGGLVAAFQNTSARFLLTSYNTDWLFPTAQAREVVSALIKAGRHVTFTELTSPYGHDAFLIDMEPLREMIDPFLTHVLNTHRGSQPQAATGEAS